MRSRALLALALPALLVPATAEAAFHLMKVVEVFPGTTANPNAQYIVLQMFAGGQTFVSGHFVRVFDAAGAQVAGGTFTFSGNVGNGGSQAKILIATAEAAALFGTTADLTMNAVLPLRAGKVCFDNIDCVAWGAFTGSTAGVGTPFNGPLGLVPGQAAKRKLGANNTLENADDTNVSANDFLLGAPAPFNNNPNDPNPGIPASTCGDTATEGLEECDDGNTAAGDGCDANCVAEFHCGDGVTNAGEDCDDGNLINTDACQNDCTGPVCGNGVVQPGETCDDGNTVSGDGCSSVCQTELASCGDGILDAGEQCDDNNNAAGDGCSPVCQNEICGNNILDPGEQCDDGNAVAGDGCRNNCTSEVCGDGTVDPNEECDDGNTASGDGCQSTCALPFCGDGTVDPGEECEDGNEDDGDGCTGGCLNEVCGDGVVNNNGAEQCDEGNSNSDDDPDACREDCQNAACGDGTVDSDEECDDGNTASDDGCDSACNEERGGLCAVSPISRGLPFGLVGLLALFALGLAVRRRR
jgi:cysteine-rich repeat protein